VGYLAVIACLLGFIVWLIHKYRVINGEKLNRKEQEANKVQADTEVRRRSLTQ